MAQALSQKEGEKAALTERLAGLQQDLETARLEMERGRRDALSLHEQDKVGNHDGWGQLEVILIGKK